MPRASPPINTGQFVSRRDRPEHQQRRAGTGRQITNREFGVLGRHTGAKLQQTSKDLFGFDDLDQAWRSDEEDDRVNGATQQARSSLFPESPISASTAPNDLDTEQPEIAAKKLEFNAGQNNFSGDGDDNVDYYDDHSLSEPEYEFAGQVELLQSKILSDVASSSIKGPGKSTDQAKKVARKGKVAIVPPIEMKSTRKGSGNGIQKSKQKTSGRSRINSSPRNIENDENEEPSSVGFSDSFNEDTETVANPSPVAISKPTVTQPAKSVKPSKKPGQTKKKRRQTLLIIDEAQESGIIDEETMVIVDDKLVRRSHRSRCKPVNFFECEQPNYIRGPGGLFSLDPNKAVIKHVPTPPPPPARRIRKKRRRQKSGDESTDEEEDLAPLSGETKVIGPNGKERRQIVAVRASDHTAVKVATKPPPGEKAQDKELAPTICKFDGLSGMATGIIQIPALGTKYPETVSRAEVFFVGSCERNALLVKINNHEFKLSKGDTFMVPANNSYSMQNVSLRKPAQVFFCGSKD